MGLRLLLDEDSEAKLLVALLVAAGHDVETVSEAKLAAHEDSAVLAYAHRTGRALLTRNCEDFRVLHTAGHTHSGVLAVFQHPDRTKNMSYADIVRAVRNVESANVTLEGEFIVLNRWNYEPK